MFWNREVAQRLGLEIIGPAVADSGNKTSPAEVSEISEIRIGELIPNSQRIFVTPFPASYPFDGFLGADLFKQFVVTITSRVQSLPSLLRRSLPRRISENWFL